MMKHLLNCTSQDLVADRRGFAGFLKPFSLLAALLLAAIFATSARAADYPNHPLDPLSRDEIAATVAVLKSEGKTTAASRYATIVLREPPKAEVLGYVSGSAFRREALAVVYERAQNKTFEAVVDLKKKTLLAWREIPGAQPNFLIEEFLMTQQIVRADPQWQEAIRKRGISNFENVDIDPWASGFFGTADEDGARTARAVSYYNKGTKNQYARPIEGLIAYVNLNTRKVYKLVDTGVVPVPKETGDLDMQSIGKQREKPKPLQIIQPQGVSFEVRGNEVRWQKWRFRFGLTPREGLVLYTVGYEDEGRVRSILYRASLAEMVVPYGDPDEGWFFRNAFDEGEYGIGRLALTLEPQTDTPDNAVTFDATFPSEFGGTLPVSRALALFERDGGVLWKHADYSTFPTMHNESRRARDLVLSWFANVGNYEYGFSWIFHQDGVLEMDVQLTGIMAARGIEEPANHAAGDGAHATLPASASGSETHAHRVAPGVEAVHHQHFFNFRLDMDVDGPTNSLLEMNSQASSTGPRNPYNNAFTMIETPLRSEKEAQRIMNLASSRKWKVINPEVRNALGEPVGYILYPGENSLPYAAPNSSVRKRAGFLNAHLWATPYKEEERFAAGDYINQSRGGEGLPRWTAANRSIDKADLVLWYTLGITHIPRPEEWPVMTCHHAGFKLLPAGFFVRNPALDVPR